MGLCDEQKVLDTLFATCTPAGRTYRNYAPDGMATQLTALYDEDDLVAHAFRAQQQQQQQQSLDLLSASAPVVFAQPPSQQPSAEDLLSGPVVPAAAVPAPAAPSQQQADTVFFKRTLRSKVIVVCLLVSAYAWQWLCGVDVGVSVWLVEQSRTEKKG